MQDAKWWLFLPAETPARARSLDVPPHHLQSWSSRWWQGEWQDRHSLEDKIAIKSSFHKLQKKVREVLECFKTRATGSYHRLCRWRQGRRWSRGRPLLELKVSAILRSLYIQSPTICSMFYLTTLTNCTKKIFLQSTKDKAKWQQLLFSIWKKVEICFNSLLISVNLCSEVCVL